MNRALAHALELQREAALEGFDWPDAEGVFNKLYEEIAELRAAANADEKIEEFGDLLFVLVNLARHLDVEPGEALRLANAKFSSRWNHVRAGSENLPLEPVARLEAMEALWQQAKRLEKAGGQSPGQADEASASDCEYPVSGGPAAD